MEPPKKLYFMIYNDIQARLKSIYASIQQKYEYEDGVVKRMKSEIKEDGSVFISLDKDEHDLYNKINIIIFNLANVKDCLVKNGVNKKILETEINKSLYLQLILDLANQERHGYPLTKTRRSSKDPLIQNVHLVMTVSNRKNNFYVERNDGAAVQNIMSVIVADITDSTGNIICRLDELVDNALADWEKIIRTYRPT